jgi:uncharacterized protein (TIGR00730 family)
MAEISSICVYCGSGPGNNPIYLQTAKSFGALIGKRGWRLVFGGGQHGLMGACARAVMDNGGEVIGIIPDFLLLREGKMPDITRLIETRSMHERKQKMFDHADAFVALPGGIGTLEEIVEMMTWAQLGRHSKPIVLADIEGFWQPLCKLLEHMREEHFIRTGLEVTYQLAQTPEDVIDLLAGYTKFEA